MNVVQTYYSYANDENPISDTAGFLSADMNWKSMALSCLLLKKHYGRVTLYCNEKVRHLIIDKFGIPYDNVVEIPEFMNIYKGCNLWALPKIYTYSLQTEPFIHVDCDWFMFEKLSASVTKSDLIGQNIEYDDQFYNRRTLEKLISNECHVYSWVMNEYDKEPVLRVVNAGILGGNDIDFIQNYVRTIKDFISRNLPILQKLNDGFVNSIYEQLFFYLLAKRGNKTIGLCTKGDKLSTKFDWLPMDISYAPKTGYMHLLANLKRRMSSYVFVSNYLDYIDSEISYRISKYCYDNKVNPLINFPQWDIYSHDTSTSCSANSGCEGIPLDITFSSPKGKLVIQQMEERLNKCRKLIYREQKKNVTPLWEIASLWDDDYIFTICPNINFSEISYETASVFLSENKEKLNRLSFTGKKIYLVLIPDASMMKVHKCVITGIKAEIVEYLSAKGNTTLSEIGTYLTSKYGISFDSEHIKKAIDRTIRSMLVSNILNLNLK